MTTPDPAHTDPYVYPGTRVLINHYDIRDPVALAHAADQISYAAMYRLETNPIPGDFDLAHLQAIHKAIWEELYPWAGQIRTLGIAKDGIIFCPSPQITSAAEQTFGQLAAEDHLRGLEPDSFIDRLATLHHDINYLHPFREGNGRAQRVFLGQLAEQAGYHLAWERLDPVVNSYASYLQAARQNHEPMRQILTELVDERRPHADPHPAHQAARLHELAADIRADAATHRSIATQLRALAERGQGPHVTELRQYRDHLDAQVRAIHHLDNAARGQAQLGTDQAFRLDLLAGPEPSRTRVLEEHRVLTASWDELHASNQTLDELAAERPADLARRQDHRADLITQRATSLEATARAQSIEAATRQLRTARTSPRPTAASPAPTEHGVHAAPDRRAALPTPTQLYADPQIEPPATEPLPEDGLDTGR